MSALDTWTPTPPPLTPCPAWCETARPGLDHAPNHSRGVYFQALGDDEGAAGVSVVQQGGQAPAVWLATSHFPGPVFVDAQTIDLTPRDAVLFGRTLIALHGTSRLGVALVEAAELIEPGVGKAVDREAGVA